VTLADRRSSVLVDHIDALRKAFRATRQERPFAIDAIVILPDHLHAIFTLPPDDADFSARWRRIKGHFSSHTINAGIEAERRANGEYPLWQRRFWEHTIRDENDFARTSITFISIRSGTVSSLASAIGRTRHSTNSFGQVAAGRSGRRPQRR
jgi:putative transposase